MQIGIIGAGMAGLCAADLLVGQGHTVTLFDKGRRRAGGCPLGEWTMATGNLIMARRGFRRGTKVSSRR
jgi:uncharacterized protein with NAD-binding domain and iron-sulfur cluster